MEIPPSDSRQPPDGHEFPDFIETTSKAYNRMIATENHFKSETVECATNLKSSWSDLKQIKSTGLNLDRSISSSNYDLRPKMNDSDEEKFDDFGKSNLLHTRSQSLIDMSIFSKENSTNKWNSLAEQRKRRLSKLKGLVIPEASENEVTSCVNIPEIKSIMTPSIDVVAKPQICSNGSARPGTNNMSSVVIPSWSSMSTLPKYSPAFKRRSLQVYPATTKKSDGDISYDEYMNKFCNVSTPRANDDPKSLESIASPTRSDCSFDYISFKTIPIKDPPLRNTKDLGRHDDESDNDSAVSSSQSSYMSRCSPPSSPVSEDKLNGHNRMLKPFSVEAINRKNILASAKCRSGKDIKIGSPVIQRKKSEEETKGTKSMEVESIQTTVPEDVPSSPNIVSSELQNSQSPVLKEIESSPNIVLNEVQSSQTTFMKDIPSNEATVLVKKPVVLEVTVAAKINEKVGKKPIPTKRSTRTPTKDNGVEIVETRLSLLDRHSASSILERRNKPVNVKSLTKNFEDSSNNSGPVFPKNYKIDAKTVLLKATQESQKPALATRRRSEESLNIRRKSEDNQFVRRISQEQKSEIDPGILSNSNKDDSRSPRNLIKQKEIIGSNPPNIKEVLIPPNNEIRTVELSLEQAGGSSGITLAGGADYETKTIRIHRIRYGSVAYQDGRLKKGDKIISINGHSTAGLSHSAATELLKEPCTKFTIVVEETFEFMPSSNLSRRSSSSVTSISSEIKGPDIDLNSTSNRQPTHTVSLVKDGAGLGFSIEGGKESPKGDVPLVVKKIFAGGAADKCGQLQVGDEILSVNDIQFSNLSRIEAWSLMKKIPDGVVKINIFR